MAIVPPATDRANRLSRVLHPFFTATAARCTHQPLDPLPALTVGPGRKELRFAIPYAARLGLGGILTISALFASLFAPAAMFAAGPAATASATTTTASATTTTASACSETRWPASVQGMPTMLKAGGRAGDYIWHSSSGWHLRATHVGSARVVFTGRIVSDAPMTVVAYRLEKSDSLTLSADKLTLTYRFANYGYLDGFDFRTACAHKLVFSGAMNGVKLPIGRIWIGHDGKHPLQNPFAVLRTR